MLNALNNPESQFKIFRTKDFVKDERYKVSDFFHLKTKYGNKLVASIQCIEGERKYFLPPRYGLIVKRWASNLEDIDCTNLYIMLTGHRRDKFKTPILNFVVHVNENENDNIEMV